MNNKKSALNKLNNAGRTIGKFRMYAIMVICGFFFGVSILGLIYFIYYHRNWKRTIGVITGGKIKKKDITTDVSSEEYELIENYDNYESEESVMVTVEYDGNTKNIFVKKDEYKSGDKVDVIYNPKYPKEMKLIKDYNGIRIFLILVILFSFIGFILNYIFRNNKWAQRFSGIAAIKNAFN